MEAIVIGVAPVALALLLVGGPALAEENRSQRDDRTRHAVTIRIYTGQDIDVPAPLSLELASSLLREGGLETRWVSCGTLSPHTSCALPVQAAELSLRLVHDADRQQTNGVLPMGNALIDTTRGTGVLATLFLDRIERVARTSGVSAAVIMARAAAHEIAHLVLGTNEHGDTGIMRALWSRDMLRFGSDREWVFTADEGRRLRLALAARRGAD
jgi:hypothetical protein